MSLPSDDALMERIARGDNAACRELVDRHLPPLFAFCQRVLGNRADAEDVAQEVFVRAWAKAHNWSAGSAKVSTWMHTVALNLCRDRLRRRQPVDIETVPETADLDPSAEDRLGGQEIGQQIDRALAGLPDRQREVIVLSHYQHLDNPAIAEVLDISVQAVESLLARARRSLRQTLKPLADDVIG